MAGFSIALSLAGAIFRVLPSDRLDAFILSCEPGLFAAPDRLETPDLGSIDPCGNAGQTPSVARAVKQAADQYGPAWRLDARPVSLDRPRGEPRISVVLCGALTHGRFPLMDHEGSRGSVWSRVAPSRG